MYFLFDRLRLLLQWVWWCLCMLIQVRAHVYTVYLSQFLFTDILFYFVLYIIPTQILILYSIMTLTPILNPEWLKIVPDSRSWLFKAAATHTDDFLVAIFWNYQQTMKICCVATHERVLRQSEKVVKAGRDQSNKLNISRRVDIIIGRSAASTAKHDTVNR